MQDAFRFCTNLKTVTIPDSVTQIVSGTFYGCDSLTDVYYGGTALQWSQIEMGGLNDGLDQATIHFAQPVAGFTDVDTGDYFAQAVQWAVALCTTGLENYTTSLGMGKWITSVTMTIFYVLLYSVWRRRYQVQGGSGLTAGVYLLAILCIVLCMMPQNQWLSASPPLSWGIWRNIPFALLGLVIIVLFYRSAKSHGDRAFRWMWLTILLSFGFYIPVVLWAEIVPMVGMLMIPKTCAYVWTVLIGYWAMKEEVRKIG